jgi:hypothetical protein
MICCNHKCAPHEEKKIRKEKDELKLVSHKGYYDNITDRLTH